jgi:hypothetical protein
MIIAREGVGREFHGLFICCTHAYTHTHTNTYTCVVFGFCHVKLNCLKICGSFDILMKIAFSCDVTACWPTDMQTQLLFIDWQAITVTACWLTGSKSYCLLTERQSQLLLVDWQAVTVTACWLIGSHSYCLLTDRQSQLLLVDWQAVRVTACWLKGSHNYCLLTDRQSQLLLVDWPTNWEAVNTLQRLPLLTATFGNHQRVL